MTDLQKTPDPKTFDLNDWIAGAKLPQESVDLYQRPDVIGRLSAVKRQLDNTVEATRGEASAADRAEITLLEAEYQKLLDTFSDSKMTVYVRALTDDEKAALRKLDTRRVRGGKGTVKMSQDESNLWFSRDLLAASVVAVEFVNGERTQVSWTSGDIKKLESVINGIQLKQLLAAYQTAQNRVPTVDADFLQRRSGSETGAE